MNNTTAPLVVNDEESARLDAMTRDHTVRQRTAILSINPDWLDILEMLAKMPCTVTELQKQLNLSAQSTVSNRLARMYEANLVTYTEMGSAHLYRLIPESITSTAADIRETARRIEETAARIERLVKKKKRCKSA